MATASLVFLLQLLLAADSAPAAASGETILWFGPADADAARADAHSDAIDGAALLDAVAVYTLDLKLTVTATPGVPPPANPDAVARAVAALRARGARLGFWCQAATGDVALALTIVDRDGRLESRPVEGRRADRPELYRAVALKVRAALVSAVAATNGDVASSDAAAAPAEATRPHPPPPPAQPAPAAATPAAVNRSVERAVETSTGTSVRAGAGAAAGPAARRFSATLGYRLSAPMAGGGGLRHAVAAEAVRPVHRALELGAGVEVATRASASQAAGSVSLFDLPVWVAARLIGRRGPLVLGAGPFAAAHFLWATAVAADGGQRASSFAVAGGAGIEALARARLGGGLAAELRLFTEAAVPGTRYWVRDVPILERGARFGAGLGLLFPAP